MSEEQESQKEAIKNSELPAGVLLNDGPPIDEYAKENGQVKDKLAEFGETDLEQFTTKVGSNVVYARQVVRKLLGLDADKPFLLGNKLPSRQENNITGALDHSEYPPKLKEAPVKTASGAAVQDAG